MSSVPPPNSSTSPGIPIPESLELLFELSMDMLCVAGVDGYFKLVNPAFTRVLGYSREELLSRPFIDFVHPDDISRTTDERMRLGQGQDTMQFENRYLRKDGRYVWLQWSARSTGTGLLYCGAREITDQRRLTSLLGETQRSANVGGWELDFRTGELYWTEETHRIHETDPNEFTPTLETAVGFYSPESLPVISAAVEEARVSGKPWDLELTIISATGREVQVRAVGRADLVDGEPIRVYGSFQDITERKELEERLLHSQRLEGLGRLAGGVAHDFNNLLTVILGNAELLEGFGDLPEAARSAADSIRQAAVQASHVTGQLLAFARKQITDPQILDLGERVESLSPVLDRLLGEGIQLTTHIVEGPRSVLLDPGHFEQVLVNLTVNASDSMPHGGDLVIQVKHAEVCEADHPGTSQGESVEVIVTDTGEGIAPDILPHIFDPFFTTKDQGKGTGLGLSTCHGIVEQNGGHIRVHSTPGEGTSFHVCFPHVQPGELGVKEGPEVQERDATGTETLLLVEDEPLVRQIAEEGLKRRGYQVLSASDGPAAIELARQATEPIDGLVTDVVLPGMAGREVARIVHDLLGPMPTLYVSGYTGDRIDEAGIRSEGAFFLQKPFTARDLSRSVRHMLGGPSAEFLE